MSSAIPLHRASNDPSDLAALGEALALGGRSIVARLESSLARIVPRPYGVAIGSPGIAYEVALRSLGIGRGDEVIVPAIGPAAAADAVHRCGAVAVHADVDPGTLGLTAALAEPRIGERTRAVLAFALLGDASSFAELARLCTKHEIPLIEDASDAIAGRVAGESTGRFGRISIFALTDDRPLAASGLTLLLTHDDRLATSMRSLRGDADEFSAPLPEELAEGPPPEPRPAVDCAADDLRAAMALCRLARLEASLESRRRVADAYLRRLAGHADLVLPAPRGEGGAIWPRFCVRLGDRFSRFDRDEILLGLRRHEIVAGRGSPALCRRLDAAGLPGRSCPIAERAADRSLLLPFYESLSEREIDLVCQTLDLMISRLDYRQE